MDGLGSRQCVSACVTCLVAGSVTTAAPPPVCVWTQAAASEALCHMQLVVRLVTTIPEGSACLCVESPCAVLPVPTGALLSLCLLAQVYDHTLDLITRMAALPLGAEVLVQVRAL